MSEHKAVCCGDPDDGCRGCLECYLAGKGWVCAKACEHAEEDGDEG